MALSSLFKYARQRHLYMSNPVREVAALEEDNERKRWLSEEEMQRLLAAARVSRWDRLHLLVVLALGTGARAGELVGKLTWQSLDWQARTAVIRQTKNGTDRTLVFPKPAMEELLRFRKADGLVFGREDAPAAPFTWRKHWNRAVRQAKLKDFRFHDLRHTAASAMVSAGVPLYNVGQVLGHSAKSPQSTARYAHLSMAAKQKATDQVLGKMLHTVMEQ
jgi:integrase